MNTTTLPFQLDEQIMDIVPNVFDTMLTMQATACEGGDRPPTADRITGSIGLGGENVAGAIYIHLPEPLAFQAVNAMLGNPADQPVADGDLNDVVGELANMVGGGLKSTLCNAGWPCAISTPSIIRGAYAIEGRQELTRRVFHFTCLDHRLSVEVHLNLDVADKALAL